MTLFHPTDQAMTRAAAPTRPIKAPAWISRVAWFRLAALAINLLLWAGIILGVRALLRH